MPTSSEPSIRIEGLGKSYEIAPPGSRATTLRDAFVSRIRHPFGTTETETFWALRGVTAEVQNGDVVGIIGGNGAGKSTLLKILCRITEPSEGTATLRGRVGSLLEVGTGFHPELTGRENVYLNGAILGMQRSDIDRRFDDIVEFSGVGPFLDTPVKRFSSGMYVRLAFAVAAHLEPEILIVDEVLAVGDAEFQQRCLGRMEEAATQEGRTILFVSHNLAAIEALCTRALYLRAGRVEFDGTVAGALEAYLSGTLDLGRDGAPTARVNPHNPSGAPLIEDVAILDRDNAPATAVPMGTPLAIRLRARGLAGVQRPVVGIRIRSALHGVVTSMSTRMAPLPTPAPGVSDIIAAVEDCTLAPGDYLIDFTVKEGTSGAKVDSLEGAARFSIVARDFYGTGYQPVVSDGFVYLRHHWEVRPPEGS